MCSFVSRESDSSDKQFYSRKEKSLGLLCSNFLRLYNSDGVQSIGLDDAATRLGVERRRIYDVVNILESVGVVARKQKNQYSWRGFEAIPLALKDLKEEDLGENFGPSGCCNSSQGSSDNENEGASSAKNEGQKNSSAVFKTDSKREKSLWLLSQNFVKLFLRSDVDMITLDNAARALLGDGYGSTAMRTKVRRLYDITNVFASMNLIEKTHHPDSRKPAIRWLGWRGKASCGSGSALNLKETQKREFGTEITNSNLKRRKEDSLMAWRLSLVENTPRHIREYDSENKHIKIKSEPQSKHGPKDFVFGPFSPVSRPGEGKSGEKIVRRVQDWETLASTHSPRYCNQAMSKLFGHYMEAWKSWHIEIAGKEQIKTDPDK
ncbi:E2F transcription factor-like E2FF [Tripterygium wilfordii]|uniref:E2F transcription factor-like E2FF n=1 Tax=Tripterygium wilfordii TaxID=458696 RepID=A0A7J7D1X8_TRIWF|nr:E2F transcription factor-like E2FF [Tripterygium wilfordii]KAF5740334.1 E2F transcription factor-like E2FF [Tripterygium wilfordii]